MAANRFIAGIKDRVRRWALRRQGVDVLPLTLASRRIYILPTRAGWIFAMLIVVTFIGGMNYGNGLALLLAFWLTGFAVVAMVQTQRSLAGTTLTGASATPAFAGETVQLSLRTVTRDATADLQLSVDGPEPEPPPAGMAAQSLLQLGIAAKRRGRWRAPLLRLSSTAPFGLFHTWTWLALDVATLVYPHPAGDHALPESPGGDSGNGHHTAGQDELAWLRDFRAGDSPRQVAWKAYARGAPLLVREYHGHAVASHEFDYSALSGLAVEARLSQLARWCVDAAARGEHWTLRLPGTAPLAGSDALHLEHCLQRLALHGHEPEQPA